MSDESAVAMTVVVGGQFGLEAKAPVVGFMASGYDVVVKAGIPEYADGVYVGDQFYLSPNLPSGWIHKDCYLIIGPGAVIDLKAFRQEVEIAENLGLDLKGRLSIDRNASVFAEQVDHTLKISGKQTTADEFPELDPYIDDTLATLNLMIGDGKSVLVEGIGGAMISMDHGYYPRCGPRNFTASSVISDVGIPPMYVNGVVMVISALAMRGPGNPGPFGNAHEVSPEMIQHRGFSQEVSQLKLKGFTFALQDPELLQRAIQLNSPAYLSVTLLEYMFPSVKDQTDFKKFPKEVKKFLKDLQKQSGVEIVSVSTGKLCDHVVPVSGQV